MKLNISKIHCGLFLLFIARFSASYAELGDVYLVGVDIKDNVYYAGLGMHAFDLWIDSGNRGLGAYKISFQYELTFLSSADVQTGRDKSFPKPFYSKQFKEPVDYGYYKYGVFTIAAYQAESDTSPKGLVNPARILLKPGGIQPWEMENLGDTTKIQMISAELVDLQGRDISSKASDFTLTLQTKPVEISTALENEHPKFTLSLWAPNTGFRIYRDTSVVFTPRPDNMIAELPNTYDLDPEHYGNTWIEEKNVFEDPNINYYYQFQSVNNDYLAPLSKTVGCYTLTIFPGTNIFSLPIQKGTLPVNWSSFIADLFGPFQNTKIYRWHAVAGGTWFTWAGGFGSYCPSENTSSNHIYLIYSTHPSPQSKSFVGYVPDKEDFSFTFNKQDNWWEYLVLPVHMSSIRSADSLAKSIAGARAIFQFVRIGDGKVRRWKYWFPNEGYGTDYSVQVCHPYVIATTGNLTPIWPNLSKIQFSQGKKDQYRNSTSFKKVTVLKKAIKRNALNN